MAKVQDITDQFNDLNDYDRVYRSEHGWLVKVRVEDITVAAALQFRITGSWASEETAKARRFEDGSPFIVPPHEMSVQGETGTDIAADLEQARLDMVRRVDLIASNHFARTALEGVKSRPSALKE